MKQILDMSTQIAIKNTPQDNEVWKGIGGHFDHLSQIIHEFIDNSISNFIGKNSPTKQIFISFKDGGNKRVIISIEDQGTGIEDLDTAFSLGGRPKKPDSPLNEHGFGMKHALASANPENNNWAIYTRTKDDFAKKQFKKISSPYKLFDYTAELMEEEEERWAGEINGESGTFVKFECSWEMFKTLRKGASGQPPTSIDNYMQYFVEELGFVYSNIISSGLVSLTIKSPIKNYSVAAVKPTWSAQIGPKNGSEKFDLGDGDVLIEYEFGSMADSTHNKYYKKNLSSSGLEIRINGRLLCYNIFKEVWDREAHPVYNHLLVKLNLVSQFPNRLPTTRTSKNGIREGDGKLDKIYRWVRGKYPTPAKGTDPETEDEESLFETLCEHKNTHKQKDCATTQQYIFNQIGDRARIDLYMNVNGNVTIYEGKKEKTTIKDVYQLMMYWDGCVIDKIPVKIGYLISKKHPQSVIKLVEIVNKMNDPDGNNYNFEIRTWADEGLPHV